MTYTYHQHTGSAEDGTGCYTRPVYHQHTSGCYGQTSGPCLGWTHQGVYNGGVHGICDGCGTVYGWGGSSERCYRTVTKTVLTCGREGVVEGWALGCGKTEETVEQAIISFD